MLTTPVFCIQPERACEYHVSSLVYFILKQKKKRGKYFPAQVKNV